MVYFNSLSTCYLSSTDSTCKHGEFDLLFDLELSRKLRLLLHSRHVSIWASHILRACTPHVPGGCHIAQCRLPALSLHSQWTPLWAADGAPRQISPWAGSGREVCTKTHMEEMVTAKTRTFNHRDWGQEAVSQLSRILPLLLCGVHSVLWNLSQFLPLSPVHRLARYQHGNHLLLSISSTFSWKVRILMFEERRRSWHSALAAVGPLAA